MQIKDIEQAAQRLSDIVHNTPTMLSRTFSELGGANVYFKYENQQRTGSFKVRGASNKVAKLLETQERAPETSQQSGCFGIEEQPPARRSFSDDLCPETSNEGELRRVVAASAGNHAQGLAYAASRLGLDCTIVMPRSTPIAKIAATEGYGAKVVLSGSNYDAAYNKALEIQETGGAVFIHPFDDLDVIAGQATVAMEILQDLPDAEAIVVPAGGGGLLAGVAYYVKTLRPDIKVIGVQASGAPAIKKSFDAKKLVSTDDVYTIADGIAVKSPGKLTVEMINKYVDEIVTVEDDEISSAILLLLERGKQVVEPAGAVSLAAVLNRKVDLAGKKVVCVLSGGNIDVSFIHKIVEKGLVTRGRQMRFRAIMLDVPGSLEQLSSIIAKNGANVIMVQYDKISADLNLNETIIHVGCEVSGHAHGDKLIAALEQEGYRVTREDA
ncbi:MAG: threonine ammonia-lyase [Oscillospiraceae bacterium]|nr:threonine ammonia-lyase [Oscillospiraceae bacterium]